LNLACHPAHVAQERKEKLLAMADDPSASPQERFLAAAILQTSIPTPPTNP
jgi:hypothetical protein